MMRLSKKNTWMALSAGLVLLSTSLAYPHGEDKPGPHGGLIRMPGAFHTELVPQGKNAVLIYLLDIEWKNPIVEGSEVNLQLLRSGKAVEKLGCEPKKKGFFCKLPGESTFKKGDELKVEASRKGAKGALMNYTWPIDIPKGAHDGHH